jgi:hypothetical protein
MLYAHPIQAQLRNSNNTILNYVLFKDVCNVGSSPTVKRMCMQSYQAADCTHNFEVYSHKNRLTWM